MKKPAIRYIFCFLTSLLFSSCSNLEISDKIANTVIANDDKTLHKVLNTADQNTLVIFDCHEVLITSTDSLFAPANKKAYKEMVKHLTKKLGPAKTDNILVQLRKQCRFTLVDKDLPNIIKNLQAKNIKVLVLTANWIGKFKNIEFVKSLRKKELQPFDFDFKKSWNTTDKIVFYDLPISLPETTIYPIFEDGIISSCHLDKGIVLQHFLERIPQKFNRIIFVDDKAKNIRSIETFAKTNKIPTYCVHYKKVKQNNDNIIESSKLENQMKAILSVNN